MLYIQNHYHNFWGSSFTLPFFKVDSIPGILKVGKDAKESPFWMRNQAEEGLENQFSIVHSMALTRYRLPRILNGISSIPMKNEKSIPYKEALPNF